MAIRAIAPKQVRFASTKPTALDTHAIFPNSHAARAVAHWLMLFAFFDSFIIITFNQIGISRMIRISILVIVAATFIDTQQTAARERHALLIGNERYVRAVGQLKNPGNDVRLVSKSLAAIGFKRKNITIVENADRIQMLDAIDRYVDALRKAGSDAVGFFYYSGHGAANRRDRRNYLIPVGVKALDRRVWFKAVALNDVVSKLSDNAPNAAHFVVFDACRNLLNAPNRGGKGFLPVAARRGMLIAFSTDPGETASDEGRNSGPYAAALANELTKNGQDHLDLFQNVKEEVYRRTGVQVPWTRDGLLQRVYLAGERRPEPPPPQSGLSEVAQSWAVVRHSQDIRDLEAFRKQYGKLNPLYDRFAERRISELRSKSNVAKTASVNEPTTGESPDSVDNESNDSQRRESNLSRIELTRLVQEELKRVGCLSGAIDGVWGPQSQQAMKEFNRYANTNLNVSSPGLAILETLKGQNENTCPLTSAEKNKETNSISLRPAALSKDKRKTKTSPPAPPRMKAKKTGRSRYDPNRMCQIMWGGGFRKQPCPRGCGPIMRTKQGGVRCKVL